jgi:hypothetical protein
VSFVITYEERLARLTATKMALQQTDGQTFEHLVPSVYELIMAEGLGNVGSQVFDLIIDFIHRTLEEGRDATEIRKSAVLFACGRLQNDNASSLGSECGKRTPIYHPRPINQT